MEKEPKQFSQEGIEFKEKTLEDFFKIDGNVLTFIGNSIQTQNFIANKRGVQIKNEGLNASGGTISGATISGGTTATTITGALTHTGSTAGFYNHAVVSQASDMGSTSFSDVGAAFSQATLNSNFTSAATQINAIRACLRNLGLMA